MSQKIVIPKGLINPNETTIIEIPEQIQNVETVIAKPLYRRHYTCNTHNVPYGEHPDPQDTYHFTTQLPSEQNIKYLQEEEIIDEDHTDYEDYLYQQSDVPKKYCIYKPQIQCTCHENYEINYSPSIAPTSPLSDATDNEGESNVKGNSCKWPFALPKLSAENVIAVLDVMDRVELHKFQQNLKEYQAARRKLLCETSNLETLEDISATLELLN